ncbi:MAG: NAD regulator [Caulobacter vibrioides]|uniref:NAD regulator n=1 Tax=Caulobacter vibrioides TaxID=155892 RepID=A0A258CWL2_CAUVI|nr:MAG: NAD regulator [Caulobacter vibrioides]
MSRPPTRRSKPSERSAMNTAVVIGLSAVVVAIRDGEAVVLTVRPHDAITDIASPLSGLPFGPFAPEAHRTFELGLRAFVAQQTRFQLGYVEQLYTFGDKGRDGAADDAAKWSRARLAFALDGAPWNEERVLERYELLYEAGLAPEAARDRARADGQDPAEPAALSAALGEPMISDHRRILATGLSRLRGKIKYRPVVFELTPEEFTLSTLQRTVEAIAGVPLHKQNFRRVVEREELVEGLGRLDAETGGRPAELFRFRREMLATRQATGLSLPLLRD